MAKYPASLERLIYELQFLPGIGPKSASRLAFYLLGAPEERIRALAQAMLDVKARLTSCARCGNLAEGELCEICRDPRRNPKLICVVANTRDLMAMEGAGEYKGLYHVLGGLISPLDGVGPDQLNIDSLLARLQSEPIEEVILSTNPTVSGEATALYINSIIKDIGVTVTRLASGLPIGADLEYTDPMTISRAFSNRRPI